TVRIGYREVEAMLVSRRLLALVAASSLAFLAAASTPGRVGISVAATSLAPPVVRLADLHDVSPPLGSLSPVRAPFGREGIFEPELPDRPDTGKQPADRLRQGATTAQMPAPNLTFEAQRDADNFPFLVEPPDPNIDVGPNNVVQLVNITLAIY